MNLAALNSHDLNGSKQYAEESCGGRGGSTSFSRQPRSCLIQCTDCLSQSHASFSSCLSASGPKSKLTRLVFADIFHLSSQVVAVKKCFKVLLLLRWEFSSLYIMLLSAKCIDFIILKLCQPLISLLNSFPYRERKIHFKMAFTCFSED